MKRINHFSAEDFLEFIIGQIDRVEESHNNYQHTHDRIHYDPETGQLYFEEVCINQDGGCYGRGAFGEAFIPVEWNHLLPQSLTTPPNWMDL